ncbi:MAG: septum formation initiator family protein [Desulfobacteraceae bacterium]|nr:septum formation initiator family protein [Desulfobacteraceae bacterium]
MTLFEKAAFYVGILLTLVLLSLIFFSKNGIMDYGKLKKQEAQIAVQAVQAAKENRRTEKEIKSLKHDIDYIKHLAKHEHEMAEPGELIFKNTPEKKENTP